MPVLDVSRTLDALTEQGYARGGRLPENYTAQILDFCERTNRPEWWNPHKDCAPIDHLARNEKVVEIARQYLGAEPVLWVTRLKWSFADPKYQQAMFPSLYREARQYDPWSFHYDTLDFRSFSMFVYLTDVDFDSGPHVVIRQTHKGRRLANLGKIILSDEEARQRFSGQIEVILGPLGTVLFEDTSCYHKVMRPEKKRLILMIHYVLQRPESVNRN